MHRISRKLGKGTGKAPVVSEIERARFMQNSGMIAHHLQIFEASYRQMNHSVQMLDLLLSEDLDRLERIGFAPDEIQVIRDSIAGTKTAFVDDTVRSAMDSSISYFSHASEKFARMVQILKLKTRVRRRVKKK